MRLAALLLAALLTACGGTRGRNPVEPTPKTTISVEFGSTLSIGVSSLTLCPARLTFIPDSGDPYTITVAPFDVSLGQGATTLASVEIPATTYSEVQLETSPTCASAKSLQVTNGNGNFTSFTTTTLKFTGGALAAGASEQIVQLDLAPIILALSGISSGTQIHSIAEAASGDLRPHLWTWKGGSAFKSQVGTCGTLGVESSSAFPGARYRSASWTATDGSLWLFGGYGESCTPFNNGSLNDLWVYSLSSGKWTWKGGSNGALQQGVYGVKGTPSTANIPGARYGSSTWVGGADALWIFGGYAYGGASAGEFNDLWKYKPSTGEWTWVAGAQTKEQSGTYGVKGTPNVANIPGARAYSVSWVDLAGNLWLFGGYGYDSAGTVNWLNDLWRFNPNTLEWTWISGSNLVSAFGTYGTQGVAAAANTPGARQNAVAWTDDSGTFWLFGGQGLSAAAVGSMSDLWKFTTSTGQWTWVGGPTSIEQPAVYGTKGVSASGNVPSARSSSVSWIDSSGDLWLMGGTEGVTSGHYNDLWRYNPTSARWTWMAGSTQLVPENPTGTPGVYGALGVASYDASPGAREKPVAWPDGDGGLWLMGGQGYDSVGAFGAIHDLWKFR